MVRFENVALRYGDGPFVLRDVTFDLDPGSFHFLVGASGAGKSSLLRLLYLAQEPSEGRVMLFGREGKSLDREERALARRRIGMVFQEFRLLDHLTALENVKLPLKLAGRISAEVERQVEELMSWVGLSEHLHAYPPTLSGGQQQRVAVARAVIARPALLLADEPTGNLDDAIAVRLLYLFQELNRLGTTVVIATHNEHLVDKMQQPVLRLADGQVERILPRGRRFDG